MSELIPHLVEYPDAERSAPPVIVERVALEDIDVAFARGVISVLRNAYLRQFGGIQVSGSAIAEEFACTDEHAAERQKIMTQRVEKGSAQYWVVRAADQVEEGEVSLLGLSKVAPLPREQGTHLSDVMVAQPWRKGLGSRLLHAPFAFGGFDQEKPVHLNGFVGSGVNEWYQRLGFEPQPDYGHFYIGSERMLTQSFRTPYAVGLRGIVANLEQRAPWLAKAEVSTRD
jgi:predicted N-acetyltransferase YhbS